MLFFGRRKHQKTLERLQQRHREELDIIKCRLDLDEHILDSFLTDRLSHDYQSVFKKNRPLVSICIATFNRGELLTQRTLPSLINQSYENIEIIVVGDACTDDTAERIQTLNDSRITFVNLTERGKYPTEPTLRWMVAGTSPMNHALSLTQGDFITHLDDDDYHTTERIQSLVDYAQSNHLEFIWHPFYRQNEKEQWSLCSAEAFAAGQITTSSVFYHRWLKHIGWDLNAYRLKEPGDWNRFRKFKYIGVKAERYPEPLLYHYREKSQSKS